MRGFCLIVLMSAWVAHAGVVGDFRHTRNLPGYINLDPTSATFKGPFSRNVDYGDGVILETPSELLSKYIINGKINIQKIEMLIAEIESFRENARIAYCQVEQAEDDKTQAGCKEGPLREKIQKKWDRKDINVALKYASQRLREAIQFAPAVGPHNINMPEAQDFLEAFFDALEIFQGVVQEDSQVGRFFGLANAIRPIKEILKHNTIEKGRIESANLPRTDGSGVMFYSPEELAQMEENGTDISLLDPADSGFWRAPKKSIASYNTTNYQNEEIPYFKKELTPGQISDLMDPKIPVEMYYEIVMPRGTGETPKIVAKYGNSKYKIKMTTDRVGTRKTSVIMHELMQIARDMEVNVETVSNNLASAIGFTIDGTYYKDIVKLYFEDKIYEKGQFDSEYARMVSILTKHYGEIYNVGSALKNVKVDPVTGKKYIELKHVSLERKTDLETDMNIGSFVRKGLGKNLKREHRAFAVFLAWVWDTNTKDANNALKLIPYSDEKGALRYKIAFSNSDMGSSLGSNRPNLYNFRLINTLIKDANGNPEYLRFNFWRVYPLDIMEAVTFADAKWMARLIGQLTPEQIYNANRAAGFTHVIASYYTGIMINKRNALLEALGLLDTAVVTKSGETVQLKKLEGFSGTLKGYEEFFQNGYLTDPENRLTDPAIDPFPRYWGAGITNRHIEGEPQAYLMKLIKFKILTGIGNTIYKATLSGANLNNRGIGFREMNLDDISLARACSEKCFFHGIQAGVEGFVPWRFLIDNPDPEAEAPFLLVDLYRLGFFAGANLQQYFGASIPGELSLGVGAKHYQVSEYIKLKPIMDIEEFFDNKLDLLKMPKLHFKTARAQTIASLEKGDILIQTHYIGLRSEATIKPAFLGTMFMPSVTFQGNAVRANRVTFLGQGNSKIMVGWDKFKELVGQARLNIFDLIIRISVLETKLRKLQSLQRTFSFDLNKEEDKDVLFGNLNEILPDEVPGKYVLASRNTNMNERSFALGLFTLFRRESFRRRIQVDYNDFTRDFTSSNFTYARELNKSRLTRTLGSHKSSYKVQASINTAQEVYAKIKLVGHFESMNKWKFQQLLLQYGPLLPDNFIQFDPNSVLDNFGVLEMNIETIFSDKALRKIFEGQMSKFRMCGFYSEVHKLEWTDEDCKYLADRRLAVGMSIDHRRFVRIWSKYEKARDKFWDITQMDKNIFNSRKITEGLKKIVAMLHDTNDFDYQSMRLFLAMAGSSDYYRRASMYSGLDAFPGKQDRITQDVAVSGGFGPSESMLSDSPQDEFEMFTDRIHKGLNGLFYNEMFLTGATYN